VSPVINPGGLQNNTVFTFQYAYMRYSSTNKDRFEMQASIDCGGTWSPVIAKTAATMASESAGTGQTPYVPNPADWVTVDVYNHPLWFSYTAYNSVMLRFMFLEDENGVGFGNRFYLDNLIFSDPNGVNEITRAIDLGLYPNPSNGQTSVKFVLSDAATVKIEVRDILGKVIVPSAKYELSPGSQAIDINQSNTLSKGLYFVNISMNGMVMSRKLVIE
jgi:hypothetical protein